MRARRPVALDGSGDGKRRHDGGKRGHQCGEEVETVLTHTYATMNDEGRDRRRASSDELQDRVDGGGGFPVMKGSNGGADGLLLSAVMPTEEAAKSDDHGFHDDEQPPAGFSGRAVVSGLRTVAVVLDEEVVMTAVYRGDGRRRPELRLAAERKGKHGEMARAREKTREKGAKAGGGLEHPLYRLEREIGKDAVARVQKKKDFHRKRKD
uniref:DUF834 domain-containing protein n=1 Tax=Oryza punctata TaxID=4537 RepID=A0A0E0JZE5_ORYPU